MGWPEARGGGSGAVAILSSSRETGPFSPKHPAQAQWQHWPPALLGGYQTPMECLRVERVQARKTTKMMKKTMRMRKILTISHLLEVTDWKYLRISEWAASTSSWAPSTFSSILGTGPGRKETEGHWIKEMLLKSYLLTWKRCSQYVEINSVYIYLFTEKALVGQYKISWF